MRTRPGAAAAQSDASDAIEFPPVFDRSDQIAAAAQRRYLRLRKLDLGVLLAASGFSTLSPDGWWGKQVVAAGVFGFMLVSLTMTVVLQRRRPERPWFDGRVVAESVKTLSFRYMARAEPYDGPAVSDSTDSRFASELAGIVRDRARLGPLLDGVNSPSRPPISWSMRQIRGLDLPRRKAWYLQERIQNQADWYAAKSSANERAARRWALIVAVAKIASLVAAAALIWNPESLFRPTVFFVGVAAVAMAWNQLRQHETLAQTYALTAQELASVRAAARGVDTDEDFSMYVADAENAISREHTLWRARRDHD